MATTATNTLINMGQATAMKVIAQMAAVHLSNSTVMAQLVHRSLQREFANKGDVITFKKPQRSVVYTGGFDITNQIQSTTQQSDTMTVDKTANINFEWGPKEMSLTPKSFFKEVMNDPMEKLPNQVDMDLLALYNKAYYVRGPAGARALNFDDIIDLGVEMNQMSIPGKRNLVLAPTDDGELAKDMKGIFLPQFVNGIVRNAQLGRLGTFQTFMDQNVKEHVQAAISGYLVNQADLAEADTTVTIDTGSGTPAVGDEFTIADLMAVNPMNYTSTVRLQRFTVESYAANVITFSPAIRTTGAYQNCTIVSPSTNLASLDDNAITFEGSHTANLAFTKNAFTLAVVPIHPVDGLVQSMASHKGINITISLDGDIRTLKSIKRMDILYGVKATYPDHAIRLMG